MTSKHIIDLNDIASTEWDELIKLASDIKINPRYYLDRCRGKIMATLFYEPSTRTQMSFQSAMLRLGGEIIGFDNPVNSSVSKGESLKDTIRIVSGYSDIIVIRHPEEGSAKAASMFSLCPIINAGDGGHLHPTQTLTDIVTLSNEKQRLSDLKIGVCGDLKYGRTVHSLIKALSKFKSNHFYLISTPDLCIPKYIKEIMDASGCSYSEVTTLDECIGDLDVLYMTRIQRERFATPQEYEKNKGVYILDKAKISKAKKDLAVMHPLPRVDEIEVEIDDDSRAVYYKQAEYGMYARMALILKMLEEPSPETADSCETIGDINCQNPRCITHTEKYLPHCYKKINGVLTCDYCETKV